MWSEDKWSAHGAEISSWSEFFVMIRSKVWPLICVETFNVLVKANTVKESVKSGCIYIVSHVDMNVEVSGDQELVSAEDGRFQILAKLG